MFRNTTPSPPGDILMAQPDLACDLSFSVIAEWMDKWALHPPEQRAVFCARVAHVNGYAARLTGMFDSPPPVEQEQSTA